MLHLLIPAYAGEKYLWQMLDLAEVNAHGQFRPVVIGDLALPPGSGKRRGGSFELTKQQLGPGACRHLGLTGIYAADPAAIVLLADAHVSLPPGWDTTVRECLETDAIWCFGCEPIQRETDETGKLFEVPPDRPIGHAGATIAALQTFPGGQPPAPPRVPRFRRRRHRNHPATARDWGTCAAATPKWLYGNIPPGDGCHDVPCVLGGAYAIRAETYFRIGQPLGMQRGFGAEEPALSLLAWSHGIPSKIRHVNFGHYFKSGSKITPAPMTWANIQRNHLLAAAVAAIEEPRYAALLREIFGDAATTTAIEAMVSRRGPCSVLEKIRWEHQEERETPSKWTPLW